MIAAVFRGPGEMEATEVDVPEIGPDEVLMKVGANTLCGTDGRILRGEELAGLAGVADDSVDFVLNNPPFHSHQATTDATALRMFTGARRVLRPGGELWVVGNRHLGHHVSLRRIFGNCRTVAGNPKFVVLRATKR